MKDIKLYITEKLKIRKSPKAKFYPTDKDELRKIITDKFNNGDNDLRDIDVSKVTSFEGLFRRLPSGSSPHRINSINVTGWNTSNVTNMKTMFFNNFNLEEIIGIEDWDVSNVTSMKSMFCHCYDLKLDLSMWKISPECDVERIVKEAENIKLPKLY